MESREQLRKIAIYCDEYDRKTSNSLKSSINVGEFDSSTNCGHYHNHKCELDLIDKVLTSLSMDLDLK